MKIHEYQAKEIFTRYGVPVPNGSVAKSAQEAQRATLALGGQAVLKAQVHAGGRGKAGGIKVVRSPEEAEQVARSMLGKNLVTPQTDASGVPLMNCWSRSWLRFTRKYTWPSRWTRFSGTQ